MNRTVARFCVWLLRLTMVALAAVGLWLVFSTSTALILLGLGSFGLSVAAFWLQHTLNWLYPSPGKIARDQEALDLVSNAIRLHKTVENHDL